MKYANTDMRHINKGMNNLFPVPSTMNNKKLIQLTSKLMESFENNIELRRPNTDGIIEGYYQPIKSNPIIDEIDKVLAEHYGFTNEELDFIINYDIKYRMGKGLEGADEDNIQYQTQPHPELKAAEGETQYKIPA